jgi:hypothetical protein
MRKPEISEAERLRQERALTQAFEQGRRAGKRELALKLKPLNPRHKAPGERERRKARKARDQAIDQVQRSADQAWLARAMEVVCKLAAQKDEFTSDDVWRHLESPREPRALGAVMRDAMRERVILRTSRTVESTRGINHRRSLRVWASLIRRPEQEPEAPRHLNANFLSHTMTPKPRRKR